MKIRYCNACRHWRFSRKDGLAKFGECFRNSPRPVVAGNIPAVAVATWPSTRETDYCGDWEEKESTE